MRKQNRFIESTNDMTMHKRLESRELGTEQQYQQNQQQLQKGANVEEKEKEKEKERVAEAEAEAEEEDGKPHTAKPLTGPPGGVEDSHELKFLSVS